MDKYPYKSFLILLLVLLLACDQKPQQNGPTTIQVSSPVNFGEVPLGLTHKFEISILNTGQNPMQLKDVMVPCTCTKPTWEKRAIEPQEKMAVFIEFTPSDLGAFQEEIMLTGNFEPTYVKLEGNVSLKNY